MRHHSGLQSTLTAVHRGIGVQKCSPKRKLMPYSRGLVRIASGASTPRKVTRTGRINPTDGFCIMSPSLSGRPCVNEQAGTSHTSEVLA